MLEIQKCFAFFEHFVIYAQKIFAKMLILKAQNVDLVDKDLNLRL